MLNAANCSPENDALASIVPAVPLRNSFNLLSITSVCLVVWVVCATEAWLVGTRSSAPPFKLCNALFNPLPLRPWGPMRAALISLHLQGIADHRRADGPEILLSGR